MRLVGADPDIETLFSRIQRGDLNLQPDFQRGEVWSKKKKQKLIDSILRNWHVPPIHVVERGSDVEEVLDGQQRLVAIRDFCRNEFPIDGQIEPLDQDVLWLDGLKFCDLPDTARRQFNRFTVRVFRIIDYKPSEPAELFFRLNQPTNLTSAEQRNAFFGPVREQVKAMVARMESLQLTKEFVGFSNARMAFDDIIARLVITLERGSIGEKLTSVDMVELYRREHPISHETESLIHQLLEIFGELADKDVVRPRFNKATFYSWLVFVARGLLRQTSEEVITPEVLAKFMEYFVVILPHLVDDVSHMGQRQGRIILEEYHDRATSRVADVSSVVLRDYALWTGFSVDIGLGKFRKAFPTLSAMMLSMARETQDAEALAKTLLNVGWGRL